MITDCLVSARFADEIIVVDNTSTDATVSMAKSHAAKIVRTKGADYSQRKNDGLKAVSPAADWVLFLDADERIGPLLRQEILQVISRRSTHSAYAIPRQNIFLGQPLFFGGWGNDYVIRLFHKPHLRYWQHPLHEEPVYTGTLGKLVNPLVHFSHRDLASMVDKTILFTGHEARLRLENLHPPVAVWRFIRVMLSEFWHRFIKLSAWRDGTRGVIDGLFQVFNMFIIYARLWELQHNPRLQTSRLIVE